MHISCPAAHYAGYGLLEHDEEEDGVDTRPAKAANVCVDEETSCGWSAFTPVPGCYRPVSSAETASLSPSLSTNLVASRSYDNDSYSHRGTPYRALLEAAGTGGWLYRLRNRTPEMLYQPRRIEEDNELGTGVSI